MTAVFHGVGDRGGAPKEPSVKTVCDEIKQNNTSDIEVLSAPADQIFRDIDTLPEETKQKLPVWNNELVMTNHAVGGYTSRAIGKRWNRRNEELADMHKTLSQDVGRELLLIISMTTFLAHQSKELTEEAGMTMQCHSTSLLTNIVPLYAVSVTVLTHPLQKALQFLFKILWNMNAQVLLKSECLHNFVIKI